MASQEGTSMQMKMQCLFQFLSKPPLIDKSSKLEKLIQVMFFNQYLVISFTNIRYRYQGTSLKCNLTRSLSEKTSFLLGGKHFLVGAQFLLSYYMQMICALIHMAN